ncbi:MAG: hypothetical protein NW216_04620 [Hyphomicrobium sp.]|nr:hypothetical protein [Hyphomicrobium sp.]
MRLNSLAFAVVAGLGAMFSAPVDDVLAGSRKSCKSGGAEHNCSSYYRGTRVKGYVERRGGYSYSKADTINTYGDSRARDGSAGNLRDPGLDRQTNAGPFDHGFFFDSAIAPRGGDSPYMN